MLNYFEINDEFVTIHASLIRISILFVRLICWRMTMGWGTRGLDVIGKALGSSRIRNSIAMSISMMKRLILARSGLLILLFRLSNGSTVKGLLR